MEIIADIETTGLTPPIDRILCISLYMDNKNVSFCEEDEKNILLKFWETIHKEDVLIGFCFTFDMQFIITRSIANNIKIPFIPEFVDIREKIYFRDKFMHGKLREFALMLGVVTCTEDGSFMRMYYEMKDFKKIIEHCEEDLVVTRKLVERCRECGLI